LSNSAFPSLIVANLTVPDASCEASGVDLVPISLISSLILRATASWTAPGGLSAISSTSRKVNTSLMREPRDWTSSVVGPSNWRNSYDTSVHGMNFRYRRTHPIAPYCPSHPRLDGVICCCQHAPGCRLAHHPEESCILHQRPETKVRYLQAEL